MTHFSSRHFPNRCLVHGVVGRTGTDQSITFGSSNSEPGISVFT